MLLFGFVLELVREALVRVQIKLVIRDNLAGNLFEVGKVAIDRNLLLRKQKDLYITIV